MLNNQQNKQMKDLIDRVYTIFTSKHGTITNHPESLDVIKMQEFFDEMQAMLNDLKKLSADI